MKYREKGTENREKANLAAGMLDVSYSGFLRPENLAELQIHCSCISWH